MGYVSPNSHFNRKSDDFKTLMPCSKGPSRLIRSCGRCIYTLRRLSSNKHNWGGPFFTNQWTFLGNSVSCYSSMLPKPDLPNSLGWFSTMKFQVSSARKGSNPANPMLIVCSWSVLEYHSLTMPKTFSAWWYTYPSEKWWSESQLGWWNSQLNGKS